jgi:hypothetical protein
MADFLEDELPPDVLTVFGGAAAAPASIENKDFFRGRIRLRFFNWQWSRRIIL